MAQHTPGPWLRAGHTVYALALDGRGHPCSRFTALVQSARQPHEAQDDELMANARLIASAPDLLAALEAIMVQAVAGDMEDRWEEECAAAHAAIAKAKGVE